MNLLKNLLVSRWLNKNKELFYLNERQPRRPLCVPEYWVQHLQEHEQVEHLHPVPDGAVDKREEVVAVTGISEEKYYIQLENI